MHGALSDCPPAAGVGGPPGCSTHRPASGPVGRVGDAQQVLDLVEEIFEPLLVNDDAEHRRAHEIPQVV